MRRRDEQVRQLLAEGPYLGEGRSELRGVADACDLVVQVALELVRQVATNKSAGSFADRTRSDIEPGG